MSKFYSCEGCLYAPHNPGHEKCIGCARMYPDRYASQEEAEIFASCHCGDVLESEGEYGLHTALQIIKDMQPVDDTPYIPESFKGKKFIRTDYNAYTGERIIGCYGYTSSVLDVLFTENLDRYHFTFTANTLTYCWSHEGDKYVTHIETMEDHKNENN